jgi:hypothetical protein
MTKTLLYAVAVLAVVSACSPTNKTVVSSSQAAADALPRDLAIEMRGAHDSVAIHYLDQHVGELVLIGGPLSELPRDCFSTVGVSIQNYIVDVLMMPKSPAVRRSSPLGNCPYFISVVPVDLPALQSSSGCGRFTVDATLPKSAVDRQAVVTVCRIGAEAYQWEPRRIDP